MRRLREMRGILPDGGARRGGRDRQAEVRRQDLFRGIPCLAKFPGRADRGSRGEAEGGGREPDLPRPLAELHDRELLLLLRLPGGMPGGKGGPCLNGREISWASSWTRSPAGSLRSTGTRT